jgi:hypothetical protein
MRENAHTGDGELILALAAGATVRQAAERAGIGERTAYRRLAHAVCRRFRPLDVEARSLA